VSNVLARCAERLRRLKPDWADPSKYLVERDAIARAIELEAAGQRRDTRPPGFYRLPDPAPDQHTRRLMALLAFKDDELARVRRQLAQAARARPRRRQLAADHRQFKLAF
jgi:hypothetical protein